MGLIITLGLAYIHAQSVRGSRHPAAHGYGQGPGQANNVGGMYEALGLQEAAPLDLPLPHRDIWLPVSWELPI